MSDTAATPPEPASRRAMSVWSVAALGIGSMVGAGIFALLGQAALVAGKDVYLSFLIGGAAALLSGYSYAKLAARYPSAGGIMEYFTRAFGTGIVAGALSVIYLVTLVVTVAMIAKTFGAYGQRLVFGASSPHWIADALASVVVILLVLVNMAGGAAVGRAEIVLVGIKLSILALLMLAGLPGIDPGMLTSGASVSTGTLLASVGLTFFAYAGYGMMANAAESVPDPARTIPRAIYLAVGLVIVLYVGLAIVVLGNVSAEDLSRYADTAVAQAARPVLGHFGFVIVSIGALLATASAINATLFSALAISKGLAGQGQLPRLFAQPLFGGGTRGLGLTAIAVLVMVNLLHLGDIANIAGATFLIAYLAVFVAHWRLRAEAGGSPLLIGAGFVLMVTVLAAFLSSLASSHPLSIGLTALFVLGSGILEWIIQRPASQRASRSSVP